MNLRRLLPLAGLVLFANASPIFAGVLWWTDVDLGTNVIPGAITLAGMSGTQAADADDFAAKVALGGWDAVIFGEQSDETFTGSVQTALTNYVAGGGRLIGATWTNGAFADLMQATGVGENGATITTSAAPVFAGLGPQIQLSTPGWIIFNQCYTPQAGAVGFGSLDCGGSAVIMGNNGRTFLNAAIFDSYASVADGERLIANQLLMATSLAPVPEPATAMLCGSLLGLGLLARRFQTRRKSVAVESSRCTQ